MKKIDKSTIILQDFNTPFSIVSNREKYNDEHYLNTSKYHDLIYWILFSNMAASTFFSSAYGTPTKADHMLNHETSLNQVQGIKTPRVCFLTSKKKKNWIRNTWKNIYLEILKYLKIK